MKLSKRLIANRVSWLLYKATSVPSIMVGLLLEVYSMTRETDTVNESKVENYHLPTSRHYWS